MEEKIYSTKDAEEAAYLWTLDDKFVLKEITANEMYGKNLIWFHFALKISQAEFDVILKNYNNSLSLVEPKKYAYRRNEVRKIIHEKQIR